MTRLLAALRRLVSRLRLRQPDTADDGYNCWAIGCEGHTRFPEACPDPMADVQPWDPPRV